MAGEVAAVCAGQASALSAVHDVAGGGLAVALAEIAAATAAFVAGEVAAICAGGAARLSAVHDVAGGGLAVALAEIASASAVGVRVEDVQAPELFSEFPGRFVVATGDPEGLLARARAAGVAAEVLGVAGGERFHVGPIDVAVELVARRRSDALIDALDRRP